MKKKAKFLCAFLCIFYFSISLTGCSILLKDQAENKTVITDETQLATNTIYVWHSNNGKSLKSVIKEKQQEAFGIENISNSEIQMTDTEFVNETESSTEELIDDYTFTKAYFNENDATFNSTEPSNAGNKTRLFWINKEHENDIPTLYEDDALVYYSTSDLPETFDVERFEDNGYTFGIAGLTFNDGNKCVYSFDLEELMQSTNISKLQNLSQITNTIVIDSIGGKKLTKNDIDNNIGYIKGMKAGTTYDFDVYAGTVKYSGSYTADNRLFSSMEGFQINDYELMTTNIAILHMPDYAKTGYYYIQDVGFIRYIASGDSYNENTDFNNPIIKKDNDGNIISDPTNLEDENSSEKEEVIEHIEISTESELPNEPVVYTYDVPENTKEVIFTVNYLTDTSSNFAYSSPYIVITNANGEEVSVAYGNGSKCESLISNLEAGNYTVTVYDLYSRTSKFNVEVR